MTASDKIEKLLDYLEINAKVLSEKLGYDRPQIIYDIQKGKTRRISEDLAIKIVSVFSEISKSWLLADEGEMLKSSVSQSANGNNVTQVAGNGNRVNNTSSLDKALDEIAEQRKLVAKSQEQITKSQEQISKSQEQIDRLLNIIEQMTKQSS